MKLSLIAAVARNGGIGKNNNLLWNEPQDQRHFRATTLGHAVVMGRKTWDSLPARFRPLPGRRNVVLTRNPHLQLSGAETAPSLPAALHLLADAPQVFVMGGAEVGKIGGRTITLDFHGIHQRLAGDAFDGFFRGGIDIADEHQIGGLKDFSEIIGKRLGAGVAVRLEQNDEPLRLERARGLQGGGEFGRVMSVVIHDAVVG